MKTSCGLLFTDGKSLLLCHVTNKPQWDIPKGVAEPEETLLQCLFREVKEETGIVFDDSEQEAIIDLGIFKYLRDKQLHLFLFETETEKLPDVSLMACNSTFIQYETEYPEVDAFKYVPFEQLENHTSMKLFPVINKVLNEYYK